MKTKPVKPVILVMLLAAVAVAVYSALTLDPTGRDGNRLGDSFDYDLTGVRTIDPALYGYRQVALCRDDRLRGGGALAVDSHDAIYLAASGRMLICDEKLAIQREFAIEPAVVALAVDEEGACYAAQAGRVLVYDPQGRPLRQWTLEGNRALITSIAVGERDVFVADMAGRVVLRYTKEGALVNRIGVKDDRRNIAGLSIPSPYFDLALSPDGLLRVVNPGFHWIEAYTFRGDREFHWGRSGLDIEGFCGCCNPSHIAILPDGRFVTGEKGITRIKVYDAEGRFESVVAGPAEFAEHDRTVNELKGAGGGVAIEVAATSRGQVVIYDPVVGEARVFDPIQPD